MESDTPESRPISEIAATRNKSVALAGGTVAESGGRVSLIQGSKDDKMGKIRIATASVMVAAGMIGAVTLLQQLGLLVLPGPRLVPGLLTHQARKLFARRPSTDDF